MCRWSSLGHQRGRVWSTMAAVWGQWNRNIGIELWGWGRKVKASAKAQNCIYKINWGRIEENGK